MGCSAFTSRITRKLPALLVLSLIAAACGGGSGSRIGRLGGKKVDKKEVDDAQASIAGKALNDEAALAFIEAECSDCHGKGKDLHSTWPMPEKGVLKLETLQSMDSIATAYQTLVNKYTKAPVGHRPSPMPPSIGDDKRDKLAGLIYWFQINMPSVVKEAEDTYGANDKFGSTLSVNLNYQCLTRTDARTYMFRLWNQALGRLPTEQEVKDNIPTKELATPITDARKTKLAKLVTEGALKDEFFKYGLKIFAARVGGSGSIKTNPAFGINDAVTNDLKDEFYQLLLSYVESKPYKDILMLDKVKVTSNTFKFYNEGGTSCADPGSGTWGECTLSKRRSNYFGTMGFLRSTPSSFLISNNNYKRGGEIHAILRGERLMAQTDGPTGEKPNPIPECWTTKDVRVVLKNPANPDEGKAPRGAVAVPREGSVCQGCHLQKLLGIASYVFRTFDENGIVFDPSNINQNQQNPYADMVKAAVTPDIKNVDIATEALGNVNDEFLRGILAEQGGGMTMCITDRAGKKSVADIATIGELVKYMIGDGSVLVHGLARYIPSAISNMPLTNQEIIATMSRSLTTGEGKLLPVFGAYFESETFACESGG